MLFCFISGDRVFHCGVIVPWPSLVLLVHVKAVQFSLVAGPASVSRQLIFWTFVSTHPDARPVVLCISHGLRILCPQPTFILVQNQATRWPATSPFPKRTTSFHLHFPEVHLWKKKEWFWRKRLVGCQTKLGQRNNLYQSGSFSKAWVSFCFISKVVHELKTMATEASDVYEDSRMFMIINEPISAVPE